jgi:hypothetical protein
MADTDLTIQNAPFSGLSLSSNSTINSQIEDNYNAISMEANTDFYPTAIKSVGSSLNITSEQYAAAQPILVANIPQNIPSIRGAVDASLNTYYMQKINVTDPIDGLEIRPPLKKLQGISMYLEMMDSDQNRKGIVLNENYIVTTLKLNPNPETFTINSAKKVSRATTMTGWVEEHWGDEIDTASLSGTTFSFFGIGPDIPLVGLTYSWREYTAAYAYLKQLVKFFQLNGCLYHNGSDYDSADYLSVNDFLNNNPDFVNNHPYKGMIKERLYLKLFYDYIVLIGRFDSFDIIEDSKSPYRLTYNIIFKAEKTIYLLDKAPSTNTNSPGNTNQSIIIPDTILD